VFLYDVYGLRLGSELRIDDLVPADSRSGEPDVSVRFASPPHSASPDAADLWHERRVGAAETESLLTIRRVLPTRELWLSYSDGTEFSIAPTGASVSATWRPPLSFDDAVVYLLGPVLGILLRLHGVTALHASVAEFDGRAVAFLGPAGAGKSTIAAACVHSGHAVLSDDLLVLDPQADEPSALPGYSRIRLWPDSAEATLGSEGELPRLAEGWEKRYAQLEPGHGYCPGERPLAAIYVIGERRRDQPEAEIAPISRPDALKSLLANCYSAHLPGPEDRRREFQVVADLVDHIPTRSVRPGGWASLRRLPDQILDDLSQRALTSA
jgi:hypothetical protein